jgi:hypothetical protein
VARLVVGAVFGIVVGVVGGAALGLHAQDPQSDVETAAAEAGVDVQDLLGAMSSTHQADPWVYLRSTGELPSSTSAALQHRLDCIAMDESRGDPNAYNPRSGASGAFQFLRSTWRSTPQGRAGLSPFDATAARAAAAWMIMQGRAREWVAVQLGHC